MTANPRNAVVLNRSTDSLLFTLASGCDRLAARNQSDVVATTSRDRTSFPGKTTFESMYLVQFGQVLEGTYCQIPSPTSVAGAESDNRILSRTLKLHEDSGEFAWMQINFAGMLPDF